MAKQIVNIGSAERTGDGESIRNAFDKINDNFTELYDVKSDFSSVDRDIVPDTDVAYRLGTPNRRFTDLYLSGNSLHLGDLVITTDGDSLQVDGERIYTAAEVDSAISTAQAGPLTGELSGSVFAQDSTLLVDAINGKIVGPVNTTTVSANEVVAGQITSSTQTVSPLVYTQLVEGAQGLDLVLRTYNVASGTANDVLLSGGESADTGFGFGGSVKIQGGENAERLQGHGAVEIGTEHTNGVTIGTYDFGDGFGSVVHLAGFQVLIGEASNRSTTFMKGAVDFTDATVTGLSLDTVSSLSADLKGSVFGDDSTLLVDGVAGKIVGDVETTSLLVNGPSAISGQLTVEESYSSTPTTKFFEIETGAGNNRLLRTGVNMSAFAQNAGPQIDLTSYRSSPQDGDAGPGFVLRASTLTSVNDVIATIGTEVTDVSAGNVTSKIVFTVQNNSSNVTPLTITGTTVDMQTADQVSISNENGAVDIYGEVEFNNGTTSFQAGNSVTFNTSVDFNGVVNFDDATIDWVPIVSGVLINNGLPVLPTQTLDINGSVFADDSTLLVDGVNGTLSASALSQDGAADGQALVWSESNNQWQPGAVAGGAPSVVAMGSVSTGGIVTNSYGIDFAEIRVSPNDVRVYFDPEQADINYVVLLTPVRGTTITVSSATVREKATTYFDVNLGDTDSVSNDFAFDFVIYRI